MSSCISVLGSTGSIGRQTLDVVDKLGLRVAALTANRDVDRLEAQCRKYRPKLAAMMDEAAYKELKARLSDMNITVVLGLEGLITAASLPEADTVVTAVSGMVGLKPTLAAIREKKRIALANKETLVCAGELVMEQAKKYGAVIIPVDSEHSAIFQSLAAATPAQREKAVIWLTCSGGPFLRRMDLTGVTVEEASTHPRWKMGRKITVDSATLMNKALEVIEARWLFDIPPERIRVVIHPQSILHSGVAFEDGAVMAELGVPDMRTPIAVAMAWPERTESGAAALDFTKLKEPLTFEAPDLERFPQLKLAWEALEAGGSATIVLNAANEAAVAAFLDRKISFLGIGRACREALSGLVLPAPKSLSDIYAADREARSFVDSLICSGRIS